MDESSGRPVARDSASSNKNGGHRGRAKSRGARGSRNKRSDMGRAEWSRTSIDKRARHEESQQAAKKLKLDGGEVSLPIYATQFTAEEIASEPKRPKRKVAVMVGYSGSGYKGMQLNANEKTIEGDLFKAFVDAGAISKANADDPKKSALIRCARTDKGVHAAGNLVSLKLIVEDPDIVSKINEKLSPQIRVFGIERTSGSFSAYQYCDSRIYEYLIPTHAFLPPHPSSYLAKMLVELAEEANDLQGYNQRQEEVSTYWAETEKQYISPALEGIDPSIRPMVQKALYYEVRLKDAEKELAVTTEHEDEISIDVPLNGVRDSDKTPGPFSGIPTSDDVVQADDLIGKHDPTEQDTRRLKTPALTADENDKPDEGKPSESSNPTLTTEMTAGEVSLELPSKELSTLETAVRQLRSAYIKAEKAYRIHPRRLERVRSTLTRYIGTQNFHNYTVDKSFRDPSAKRVIKSFVVSSDPIIIGHTEWLSLKVHGQSFMMHQIRKMVSMVAMIVRCGCHEGRIQDSYMADNISIPKAPGLGLLLERPVFDTYNERCNGQYDREPIDFKKYEKEMEEFKQREIYERIFREEERDNIFHGFFAALDHLKNSRLLYLSSVGIAATKRDIESDVLKSAIADNAALDDSDGDESVHDDDGGDSAAR